jgi:hypothetical protein
MYTNIFHCKTLPNLPKWGFWFEKKPSGNPVAIPSKIYPNWDFGFDNEPSGNPGPAAAQKSLKIYFLFRRFNVFAATEQ